MAATIEEITVSYEEDSVLLVKELDKAVLSKGAWTTIMFRYQQWDPKTTAYGPDKYTIRRYRKMNEQYSQQSKFNISSVAQAEKIVATLQQWIKN